MRVNVEKVLERDKKLTELDDRAGWILFVVSENIRVIPSKHIYKAPFLALHRSCCRSSKQDGSASLGMWHGWVTRVTCPLQGFTYISSRVSQG